MSEIRRRGHTSPRGRVAVTATFVMYGLILGSWTARIPAIKQRLRLSDGRLSVGLLAFAAGAIIGMQLAGRWVDRYGSRRVLIPAVFADGAVLVAPAFAVNLASLSICLLVFGIAHGTLNVAMNVNAVQFQRALPRPIISSCHAAYSIGGFLGAAIGGVFAYAGVSARVNFASVAVGVLVAASFVVDALAPSSPSEPAEARVGPDARTDENRAAAGAHGVIFLGVLVFCCLVGEGAAADWSAVYLRTNLETSAGFAAAAYAMFSIAMMSGRLVGDRLVLRVGRVRLVRGGGVIAAASLSLALLIDNPVAGVIGFGCFGLGLSCIAPQAFSAAAERDPMRAGKAIARVAGLGFLGFVVGPVIIGATAQLIGLPRALLIPALLALFAGLSAAVLVHEKPIDQRPRVHPIADPQVD